MVIIAKVKLINQLFDIIFQHGNIKEPMWRDKDILHLYTLEGGYRRQSPVKPL